MSQFIDTLKAQSGDPRSTRELTLVFGQQVEQSRPDVFAANPDFAQEYSELKDELSRLNRPSLGAEFMGGLKAGGNELAAAGLGLGALGTQAVGLDGASNYLLGKARDSEEAAAAYAPSAPTITGALSEGHPIEDTAYYLARGAGSMVPSIGLAAGAGLVGAGIGSLAEPGGGTIAGGLAGIGEAFAGEGASAKLIQMAAKRIGQQAAITGAFAGQSTGSNFVRHPETPGADIGFGLASGVLGALAPEYAAGKFLGDAAHGVPEAYLQRFLGEAAKTIPIGAGGTAASALVDLAAEKYARGEDPTEFTADDWKAALNAGVLGGVGGALMAPFAAIPGGARDSANQSAAAQATAAPPIDVAGLPPEVASAVRTAEVAAKVTAPPEPAPSALRQAAEAAIAPAAEIPATPAGAPPAVGLEGQPIEEVKLPDPKWKLTVQAADGDIPGFQQVDKIGPDGESTESVHPDELVAQGYTLPPINDLHTGQYTFDELAKRQEAMAPAAPESKVPVPSVENLLPVPEPKTISENATNQQQQPIGGESEHPGTPQGAAVPENGVEIRSTAGEPASGSDRALGGSERNVQAPVDQITSGSLAAEELGAKALPNVDSVVTRTLDGTTIEPKAALDRKVSQLADRKQIRAQKEFVVDAVKTALAEAPETPTGKIVIDVPGDGTFTVDNSQDALKRFQEVIAKRFGKSFTLPIAGARTSEGRSTVSGPFDAPERSNVAPAPESIPAVKKSPTVNDLTKAAAMGASTDESRYIINHVLQEGKNTIATDGRRLFLVIGGKGETPAEIEVATRTKDKKTGEAVPGGKFPNWKQVIPGYVKFDGGKIAVTKEAPVALTVDTADAIKVLNQAKDVTTEKSNSVKLYDLGNGKIGISAASPDVGEYASEGVTPKMIESAKGASTALNPEYLKDALTAARLAGNDTVRVFIKDEVGPVVVVGGKNFLAVTMPVRLSTERIGFTSEDFRPAGASGARLLDSTVRALAQDRGIPVAPIIQGVSEAVGSAVKEAGFTLSGESGPRLVGYAVDTVAGPIKPQSIISLLHEAGHVFTAGLDEPLRVSFQRAIDELPWTNQRWLNNPESLDARLIATADPATLSPKQLEALKLLTPQEIAAARALSPDILAQERMAEHLAQLGWDKQEAVSAVDRFVRFIKDLWLKTSMAIQKVLKGDGNENPELARQFVENRFLQFVNRDAAYARDRINDLKNWIGVPQTTRERQPNFPGGSDNEMRMQYADAATGTLIPISYGTFTPDSMRAYLQRSIDNADRVVRDTKKTGMTEDQIAFTKRVNFSKPLPLEPSATYNVKLASLNLEDETYRQIREDPEIARLLPRTAGKTIEHPAFLADWMKLPEQQHPETMRAGLVEEAKQVIDPTTGAPVAHDPDITINELPGYDETLIDKEKEAVTVRLSEQQDEALSQTILSLRDTKRRLQSTLARESDRLNKLIDQKTKLGKEFPADSQKELDELQRDTLVRAELVNALTPKINALDSKFDPRRAVSIYPSGTYIRVPGIDADEAQILGHTRGVVPRDLNFANDSAKARLGQDLADMKAWLDEPANRQKGPIYGTVDETYRKLLQIPTDLKRVHTAALLRRTVTNGLARELFLTGIPGLVAYGKKILTISRISNENRVISETLGHKWEVAFANFAKALGAEPDQTFRDIWWDPLNRIWDRVDVSRRGDLRSPTDWHAPVDRVVKALSDVAGLEIDTPAKREALRDLMLVTTDNNRHFMSVELQNDVKVQDDKLGYERRLVPRGLVGGRRTFARHLMGLFARMNPDWSDTTYATPEDTRSFWEAAPDLYKEDLPTFDKRIAALFPSYVTEDFVAPWVNDNDPVFPAPKTEENSAPRMASPSRSRRAWREAKGDVVKFAEILHDLEGGDEGDQAQTVGNVLSTLRSKFIEQKKAVDEQLGPQQLGTEILPRQLMDARLAHNWPAEHVSYATYTPLDNSLVLNQLAMGAALGRDALGANSEMHMTLAEARRDLAELWAKHEELVQQGRSSKEIEAVMGRDDAKIARNYYALSENIQNIERAIIGMTTHSGYLMNDFKAMNSAVSFFSSMMVQNPRSGMINIIGDVLGPLASLKLSSQSLRAFRDSSESVGRDLATAVVRAFGIDAKFNSDLAHELYVNGATEPEAAITWRQKQHFGSRLSLTKPAGYETTGARVARVIARTSARGREIVPNIGSPFQVPYKAGDEAAAVAPKLRAGFFGTTAMSTQFANNRAGYNLFAELANRGVKYLNSLPESTRTAVLDGLERGTGDLNSRQLGYNRGLVLNDEASFGYLKNAIETQMSNESSVGRFVAKAFRRQEAAAGTPWPILSNSQFSDIINLTNSYWTLQNNTATIPPWMNGPLRPLFIFLTWPYQAMQRFGTGFTDPQGRLTFRGANSTIADGMKTFFILAAPATIAGSFAIDLYDKYALGKKQNLREASLATALPGVGAVVDPRAFMERIGRYGSAGFATDLINRIVNYDTQRNLSLDDRIVAVSSIENLLNAVAVEPFQTGGNITYSSTVRPFLQAIGGGGVLQYLQVVNNLLGLKNQDAAQNSRINISNYLRASGRELQLPVRVMSGPSEAPTPISPYVRQMELAAIIDNPELFRAAYQNAIAAARKSGSETTQQNPERYVAQAFADRHPLRRLFATTPTESDYRQMLGLMDDRGAQQVRDGINSYNRYLGSFFNRPAFYGKVDKGGPSVDELIRQASRLSPGIDSELAGSRF